MKSKIILISILSLLGTLLFFVDKPKEVIIIESPENQKIFQLYQAWKSKYGKTINDDFEDAYRFSVFTENYYFVEEHNAKNTGVDDLKLELNAFGAMPNEEFADIYFGKNFEELQDISLLKGDTKYVYEDEFVRNEVPSQVDWSKVGAVNKPRNQGVCGSCWAFSSTASLECLSWKQNGTLWKFSEQQILSCVPAPYVHGCSGGNTQFGFMYTKQAGVQPDETYPYTDANTKVCSPCFYDQQKTIFHNTGGQVTIDNQRPDQMQYFASQQVLSAVAHSSNIYWQLYKEGIMANNDCPTNPDHAINIIGYDMDNPTPYWIIKNSWGFDWGITGCLKIAISNGPGVCGINQLVNFPIM